MGNIAEAGLTRVFRIPESNMARLRADIEKLNRRARRLHLEPIVIEPLEVQSVERDENGLTVQWTVYVVNIVGTTPVLAGWTFIASLSHVEGQVITTTKEGTALPDWAKSASPENCDHCHTKRDRLTTFVVQHEDGRTAQVGRNCLADFVRTTDPGNLAEQAEFLLSLDFGGYEDEDLLAGPPGRRVRDRVNAVDFMAYVLRAITRQGGFVSKKRGHPASKKVEEQPTVMVAADLMWAPTGVSDEALKSLSLRDDEREAALSVIEGALDLTAKPDPSEYEDNVRTVALMPYWEERLWGIAASIPSYVDRSRARAAIMAKQAGAKSTLIHIGTVGKREVFELTMHGAERQVGDPDDRWGQSLLYKFTDPDGNEVTYFSSRTLRVPTGTHTESRLRWDKNTNTSVYECSAPHDGLGHNLFPWINSERPTCKPVYENVTVPTERSMLDGDTVTMKATVKRHDAFQGVLQTLITRGAVLSLVSAAPGGGK